jgi:hypothetical protein
MSDDKLKDILAKARDEIEQDARAKEDARLRVVDVWDSRADLLKRLVLPRLQAAKEAWRDTVELSIQEQTTYNSTLPDRAPSISFHIGKFSPSNPGVGGSSAYFFTVTENKTFRIYEGAVGTKSLDDRVGIKAGPITEAVIDKVLEIAAKEYFRNNRPAASASGLQNDGAS